MLTVKVYPLCIMFPLSSFSIKVKPSDLISPYMSQNFTLRFTIILMFPIVFRSGFISSALFDSIALNVFLYHTSYVTILQAAIIELSSNPLTCFKSDIISICFFLSSLITASFTILVRIIYPCIEILKASLMFVPIIYLVR